jgi:hypothetical protein
MDHSSHDHNENQAVYTSVGVIFVAVILAVIIIAMIG